MTTVNFTTVLEEFPEGTVAGNYNVRIIGIDGVAVEAQNVTGTEAVFSLVPGIYTATVLLHDAAGNPLGAMVTSESFTIAVPAGTEETPSPAPVVVTVSIAVPSTITVSP